MSAGRTGGANRAAGPTRRGRSGSPGGGPAEGLYPIDTGTAELVLDGDSPDGWLLKINGVQSSHIVLSDPLRLDFEYMRWIVALVEEHLPPETTQLLRALHQGGGGCSIPRYLTARYPDSRQVVVELDGQLAEYVREWFDLPKAPLLRIRVGEARAVTESLTPGTRDLVVRDVFAGSRTPFSLTTVEFLRASERLLAPDGLFVANIGSAPDLVTAREEAASIAAVFPHVALVADPAMLKGRRFGNIVMAGSGVPIDGTAALTRRLLGGGVPAHFWDDARVRAWIGATAPRRDPS
ncbi:fused MFS/spermidine synthase [Sinomonas sp. JGH33]|uniref:Fused MFS/spermidine synthase n=1 Tax=Sinomonas terricola TaxID=3110330 RepID=A0ABU5T5C1_9MICC|nr:fused MFS/spermidine synthase [Sinomonas sp. JGH33]MEA5454858.1 fused MFS/spermidine synthase [Sinomonas sp. JGH33]